MDIIAAAECVGIQSCHFSNKDMMPRINKSIEYIELKVKHIRYMIYIYIYLFIYTYIVMVYDMFIFYIPRIMPPKQRTRTAREAKLVRGSLDTILPIFGKNTAIW